MPARYEYNTWSSIVSIVFVLDTISQPCILGLVCSLTTIEFIWWFCHSYSVNSITYRIILSHMDCNDQWGWFCSVIAAFRWFLPHVFCMLIVCRPESCCMCVYNNICMHSISWFFRCRLAGFGQYLSCFHWLILGPSREYYSPRKDTLRARPPNILTAKIFAYTVVHFGVDKWMGNKHKQLVNNIGRLHR
jgi:hypothetical protein